MARLSRNTNAAWASRGGRFVGDSTPKRERTLAAPVDFLYAPPIGMWSVNGCPLMARKGPCGSRRPALHAVGRHLIWIVSINPMFSVLFAMVASLPGLDVVVFAVYKFENFSLFYHLIHAPFVA